MIQNPSSEERYKGLFLSLYKSIKDITDLPERVFETFIQELYGLTRSSKILLRIFIDSDSGYKYYIIPSGEEDIVLSPIVINYFNGLDDIVTARFFDLETADSDMNQVLSYLTEKNCLIIPMEDKNFRLGTLMIFGVPYIDICVSLIMSIKDISPFLSLILKNTLIEKERNKGLLEPETGSNGKIEEELPESDDYYLKLFDFFPNPIWRSDITAKCNFFNKEWLRFTGRTFEEENGDGWAKGVHPDDFERCLKIFLDNFNLRKPFDMEYRLLNHDGTYHWLLDYGNPFYDSNGQFSGYIGACYDINDRRLAEDALRMANDKIRILSSITRHDILNQVNAMKLYLDLTRDIVNEPKLVDYLDIETRITENIEKQIAFTKYYENIGINKPVWHIVADLILNAQNQLLMAEKISVYMSLDNLEIYSDLLIEKVFYNLMENSIRHGERVTTINITFEERDDKLLLVYQDNGIGVPPEDKPKLFQKGFGKNTGLGLFLSHEILSITGIKITEDGIPGEGVRFVMNVPKMCYRFKDWKKE